MPSAKPITQTPVGFPEYLDFRRLREEGIRYIQQLSGDVWTDHNSHDPGITILEVLCYALLDLGYRCNLPIEALLASDPDKGPQNDLFFTAAEILGNNPLTVTDYRKLLLDIRGVRNAWLEPAPTAEVALEINCEAPDGTNQLQYAPNGGDKPVVLRGLWRVWIELDPVNPENQGQNRCEQTDASLARILDDVKNCLHQHRNLCEDFFDICVLQDEQIGVCAHLELTATADPEDVLVDLFERLRAFISPALHFYSLPEMLAKGHTMEDIFAGRPYRLGATQQPESHGFIDAEELDGLTLRSDLHTSDIMREIMGTPGIQAVSKLMLFNYIGGQPQTDGATWCLALTPGYHPVLAPEKSKITLLKDGVPFAVNMQEVLERYTERLSNSRKARLHPNLLDKEIPGGKYHAQLGDHLSIQHDFPNVYAIGEGGLPANASLQRKAQAMQLKGYLLFFDQMLADYLAQLSHIRDLFALRPTADAARSTFFPGNIQSVPDLGALIRGTGSPQGEAITGSRSLYQRRELVAVPLVAADLSPLLFHNPLQRDRIRARCQQAFENEEAVAGTEYDADCQSYRFTLYLPVDLPDGSTGVVLRSAALFDSEKSALHEAEALTFLGLGAEHYRATDRDQSQEYGFELWYNPREYDVILKELAATPAQSRNRRSRFLDHLLARFAEDFSEYALLQFKIDRARDTRESLLIETKEQFLAHYPEISRDRGTGFDYTNRQELWDTPNVSGLEKRVSSLMGLRDWKRKTLSPFAVETRPLTQHLQLLDFRGRVLFESKQAVANAEAAWPAFAEKVAALAAHPENFRAINCPGQGIFGFELTELAPDGSICAVACHPDTYCCAADRDAKLEYVSALFRADVACAPADGLGCCARLVASPQGFHFQLDVMTELPPSNGKKPKKTRIFLQSASIYTTHNEAVLGWLACRAQLKNLEHYRVRPLKFSQQFLPEITGADGQALAVLSAFAVSKEKAELLVAQAQQYFASFEPAGVLQRNPGGYTWQLQLGTGAVLLQSNYHFESLEQASGALAAALILATNASHFTKQIHDDGQASLVLHQPFEATEEVSAYTLPLAESPRFKADIWEHHLQETVALATKEAAFFRRILTVATTLKLTATNAAGVVLLRGQKLHRSITEVENAWRIWQKSATLPTRYVWLKDGDFTVQLLDEQGHTLACSIETFYDDTTASAYIQHLVDTAGEWALQTEEAGKAFHFQLTDGSNNPALAGETLYTDVAEAHAAYFEALYLAKNPENLHPEGDGKHIPWRIELKNSTGNRIAIAASTFQHSAERDAALTAWREWFGSPGVPTQLLYAPGAWYILIPNSDQIALEGLHTFAQESDAAFALETALTLAVDTKNYRCVQASDGCRHTYELLDGAAVLAVHPDWLDNEADCIRAIQALADALKLQQLPYQILAETSPRWHYEWCWETCDGQIEPALIGTREYGSEAAAQEAFCAMLQQIQHNTTGLVCAESEDGFGFAWVLGDNTAVHPRTYETREKRACAVEDLMRYAQKANWMQAPTASHTGLASYFRLNKSETPWATYLPVFNTPEQRDLVWCALMEHLPCGGPTYSYLDLSDCAIQKNLEGGYYFQLICGTDVWWRSCQTYASRQEAYAAFQAQYLDILALASNPDNYQSHCDGEAFCYFWLANPADQSCLVQSEKLPPGADLKQVFNQLIALARQYPVVKNPGGGFCFQVTDADSGDVLWQGTTLFDTPEAAWKGFEHFRALWCFPENFSKTDDWNDCRFGIKLMDAGLVGTQPCTQEIDANPHVESTYFSNVFTGGSGVGSLGTDNFFEIRSSQGVWFRSFGMWGTSTDAQFFLDSHYLEIIAAAADPAAYSTANNGAEFAYRLLPFKNLPADVHTPYFATAAQLEAAKTATVLWAKRYPIYKTGYGQYSFRIFEPGTDVVYWSSSVAYNTPAEAYRAFAHFICLFDFREVYRVGDKPVLPKQGGTLGGQVNIGTFAEGSVGKLPAPDVDCSWEELEKCLAAYDATTAGNRLYHRFMPEKDCRWGVFWASDAYRLARAPQMYHHPATRECAREALFHTLLCSGITKTDCKDTTLSPCDETLQHDCRRKWCLTATSPYCKIFYDCDQLDLFWRPDFGLLLPTSSDDNCTPQLSNLVRATAIIDLMALARAPECYVIVQDDNPQSNLMTLGLMNDKNMLVAMGGQMLTQQAVETCKNALIAQAWSFPLIRVGDKFGFQLALGETVLLENIHLYDSPFEASEDFCRLLDLLSRKTSYVGAETDDCGPFGIEIVDESAIKAWHTATYACRADALDAIQSLENCLRSEGFHVLEHILLRPKSSGKPLEEYWQICLNGQPVIKAVQPARDTSDTGRAEFYRNFRKAFKQFFDLEQPRLDWKDERTLEFYLTQPDPNGLATTTLLAVSTYPVDNNCANGFAESLLTLTEADVCLDAEEATADVLFEACVDPADCRDPELPVDCIPGADPYSFWVTVAIPWWGSRFRNLEFRHFVEKTLRREAPAHVGLRIGWLGARQMTELESRYRYWLESNALGDDNCTRQSALNALMETLKNLRNVYPETTLHDCDSGGDGSAFVLLDQTALGED